MIEDYLEFVKKQRFESLRCARYASRSSRKNVDEFIRGYYRGMRLAFHVEAGFWKELQRDIEAINAQGDFLGVIDGQLDQANRYLS